MIIELKHNPEEFMRQNMVAWSIYSKRRIERQLFITVLGLLLIILSYANSNDKLFADDCMFAIGVFMVLTTVNFLSSVAKIKKKFKSIINDRSTKLTGTSVIFDFNENEFLYKDTEISYNFPWTSFAAFNFQKGVLLFRLKNYDTYHLTISENVIGKEEMKELIAFLKTKIK